MGKSSDSAAKAAFDAALGEYFRRLNDGEKLDDAAFIAAHPDVADELRAYFASSGVLKHGRQSVNLSDASTTHTRHGGSGPGSLETIPPVKPAGKSNSPLQAEGRLSGQSFGRYEILRVLGQGAMGVVYLARDTELHREVALKVPKFTQNDSPSLIERFYRESRAAAALQHRNICPIFDIGEANGTRYITMAYIEGRPLSYYISPDRRQPLRLIAGVVRKLALALATAHERGIVHRDLKPSNILVDASKEPVIMDFGLARQLNRPEDARITQSGSLVGSPAYMSPEQVESRLDEIGPASDIFSLGIILYEFMTGELPFQGSIAVVMGKIVAVNPVKPSAKRSDIDDTLEAICLKMMAKQIGDRYGSMTEVAEVLTAYLKESPSTGGRAASPTGEGSFVLRGDPAQRETESEAKQITQQDYEALYRTARKCVHVHDYEQGLEILSQIPVEHQTDEMRRLLDSTQRIQDEVDLLLADIEDSRHRRRFEDLEEKVDRLRELKPGHPYLRQLEARASVRESAGLRSAGHRSWRGASPRVIGVVCGACALLGVLAFFLWPTGRSNSNAPRIAQPDVPTQQTIKNPESDDKIAVVEKVVVPTPDRTTPQQAPIETVENADLAKPPIASPESIVTKPKEQTARERQQAAADRLGVPLEIANSIGMTLMLIPDGEFTMGTPYEQVDTVLALPAARNRDHLRTEQPARPVRIAKPFYCGTHEVTRAQFAKFVELKGYRTDGERDGKGALQNFAPREGVAKGGWVDWRNPGFPQTDRDPVVSVSVDDAQAFCQWLSDVEGRHYRLPREAEWEYACRAGTTTLFYTGDSPSEFANASNTNSPKDSFKATAPVGSFRPNPFGLYDMLGNVWEACSDFGTSDFSAHSAEGEPPTSANRAHVVTRGGAADCPVAYCRSAVRGIEDRKGRGTNTGFRVVCDVRPQGTDATSGVTSGPSPSTNLVRSARLTASSEWSAYPPRFANDGELDTRWNSETNDGQGAWIAAQWSQPVTIRRVIVRQAYDRISSLQVQTMREDGMQWETLMSLDATELLKFRKGIKANDLNDPTANPTFTLDLPRPVKTVGLRLRVPSVIRNALSVSIFELEAYESP